MYVIEPDAAKPFCVALDRLVGAAEEAGERLEVWLRRQAARLVADTNLLGDLRAAGPIDVIAEEFGLRGLGPAGFHPLEVAVFLDGMGRLGGATRSVGVASESFRLLWCYLEQVVHTFGGRAVGLPGARPPRWDGRRRDASDPDAQSVDQAARALAGLAALAHSDLDGAVRRIAAGVDGVIAREWSPDAAKSLGVLSDLLGGEVPTALPGHLVSVAEWLSWLRFQVPEEPRASVMAAVEAVDTLALVRRRTLGTCDDLIYMCCGSD